MVMTNSEILASFNEAKFPSQQVKILAELNVCDVEDIKQILIEQGVDHRKLPRPKKPSTYVRKKKVKPEAVPAEPIVEPEPINEAEPVVEEPTEEVSEVETVEPAIEDSGNRRVFETGAVRDIQEGKGRMDLLPWAAILEVSKHCEAGARKYGEHNVDKGIPTHSLCDSAARHLAKYLDGQTNEDHLLAAAWNLLWALQMRINMPEMVDTPWRPNND